MFPKLDAVKYRALACFSLLTIKPLAVSAKLFTAVLVVTSASLLTLGTASATAAPSPGPIRNAAYSQCIDAPGGGFNVRLKLADCSGSGTQRWAFEQVGENTFVIRNLASGLCMEVNNGTSTPGETVDEFTCNGQRSELWEFDGRTLKHAGTNQCLDTVGGFGSQLMQYTCGQAAPANVQSWITPPPAPPQPQYKSYKVVNCNGSVLNGGVFGSTMTVWARDVTANGSFVQFATLQGIVVGHLCGPPNNVPQSFTFLPQPNRMYEVRVVELDNLCPNNSPTAGCVRTIAKFQGNPNGQAFVQTIGD
jgi:hypothetical protein